MELIAKVVCLVLLSMLVVAPHAKAEISCGQVSNSLISCLTYLESGGTVPEACCSGIKSLNAAASTTADRQTTCNCLKTLANSMPGININTAAGLPSKCGVSIPYKISTSVDCSKVQ